MRHSKLFATLVMAGVSACALTSCDDNKVDIVFYSSAGDTNVPLIQGVVDRFNETSEYKVGVENPGGGYDGVKEAVIADISAGTVPAIAYCYPDHVAEYLEAGVVIDLNQYINDPEIGYTDEEIADFIPGYWREGYEAFGGTSENDPMYTVPFSKSTEVMYYNKTALQDIVNANIGITQEMVDNIDNWTWDEFWNICEIIESKSKYGTNWVPMGYDSVDNWFITLCEQYGIPYTSATGEHYLFNNEEAKNMLADLNEKFKAGLFTTQDIYGAYTSGLFTEKRDVNNPEACESCVFCIGSSAGASHQVPAGGEFEVGITSIPQVDPENKKSINQGPSLVLFDLGDSEEAQAKERAAWLFVKELLEPEFQAQFSRNSGYLPVRLSAQEVSDYSTWLESEDPIAQTIKYALGNFESYFVSPAFNGSNKARSEVGAALNAVLTGNKTPEEALQDAYDMCIF